MAIEVGRNVLIPLDVSPSGVTATGSTAARSLQARFADVVNVKDFGAKGDGATDDAAAIQAAVAALSSGGTLWFPRGTYLISATITLPPTQVLTIKGAGRYSQITGSVDGFLLDKPTPASIVEGVYSISDLALYNTSASGSAGGIRISGAVSVNIDRVRVDRGAIGIDLSQAAFSASVTNSRILGFGNVGIGILGGGNIINCDVVGWAEGVRAFAATNIRGGRYEVNTLALNLGTAPDGSDTPFWGSSVEGMTFEANDTDVYARHVAASVIGPFHTQGSVNSPSGQSQRGLRVGTCANVVFKGIEIGGSYSQSSISIEVAGSNCLFEGVSASNSYGGAAATWKVSASLSGYQFLGTNYYAPALLSGLDSRDPASAVVVGSQVASTVELGRAGSNLILQSQAHFATAPWIPTQIGGLNVPTVTDSTADLVAPDGTGTASKIVIPAVSVAGNASYVYQGVAATAAPYVFSVYLRTATGTANVYIASTWNGATFVQTDCAVTTAWSRCSVTGTLTANTWFWEIGTDLRNAAESATPDTTVYVWGAQLERGSTPNVYVPTTSGAVNPVVKSLSRFQANGAIYPATPAGATQLSAAIYAGTGAPSNDDGTDGDLYLRSDGGTLTTLYQKRSGAWVGIL